MRLQMIDRDMVGRYAPYAALAGAFAVVIALGAWLVAGQLVLWIEIVGGVGLLLLAGAILLQPGRVRAALGKQQTRYGGNAALMIVAFMLIMGLVNYLGMRHHWRWDVTEEKQFSLSDQSLQVLRGLAEPVKATLFFTPANPNLQQAEDLLKEYVQRSDKISYEIVDPDLDPRRAMDYQVSRDGTIIFERGQRRELSFGVQEQDLTGALLKVSRDEIKGVYFLTGHQERDPESGDASGYSLIRQTLERENYRVATYNAAVTDTFPVDMTVLVVAAPQRPLGTDEAARLVKFVAEGGSLLVMIDPGLPDPLGGMLSAYGIELPDDIVVDPTKSFFGDIASPLVDRYTFHQITKDMEGLSSILPTARSLVLTEPRPEGWNVTLLASSSADSWGEKEYRAQQVKPDPDEVRGPLGLVAAIEPSAQESGQGRLVVMGDASLVEDGLLGAVSGNLGNVDLFMNAVGWLAEDEALISIRPKQPELRQVILTPPQARAIIYSSILFVPLLVLAAGLLTWWRQR